MPDYTITLADLSRAVAEAYAAALEDLQNDGSE